MEFCSILLKQVSVPLRHPQPELGSHGKTRGPHTIPVADFGGRSKTLIEALELVGLEPVELRTRFLPYTTKSLLPQNDLLVMLYLWVRPLQWLLGRQTWLVALKRA